MSGKLFVISASSGAGKTSLVKALVAKLGSEYALSRLVTYTTKQPRKHEVNGQDYFFVSEREFKEKIELGFFIEWSNAYGAFYGSPKSVIDQVEAGRSSIAIVDMQGAHSIKKYYNPAIAIWLQAPHLDILKERLLLRSRESGDEIAFRCSLAEQEAQMALDDFNYAIVNDNFEHALADLERLVKQNFERS